MNPQQSNAGKRSALKILVCCVGLLVAISASAQTLTTFYTFQDGADGRAPSSLVLDQQGNLIGATNGGAFGFGSIFQIDSTGAKTILYSFTGGSDGGYPTAGISLDKQGNVYGVLQSPGAVFKWSRVSGVTILHTFQGPPYNVINGGMVIDSQGNLYGTTSYGGANNRGTVFKIDANGVFSVIYDFLSASVGSNPEAGLLLDSKGNLYGTTLIGGAYFYGTVFEIAPDGTEKILHSFQGIADGSRPQAALIQDRLGNLYGTTKYGGSGVKQQGFGSVFEITAGGKESVIHGFNDADGRCPCPSVVMDASGNLYGTSLVGGSYGHGTVFKISPTGVETVLFSFLGKGSHRPSAPGGLVIDAHGTLYGTLGGGAFAAGTVFKLTVP